MAIRLTVLDCSFGETHTKSRGNKATIASIMFRLILQNNIVAKIAVIISSTVGEGYYAPPTYLLMKKKVKGKGSHAPAGA